MFSFLVSNFLLDLIRIDQFHLAVKPKEISRLELMLHEIHNVSLGVPRRLGHVQRGGMPRLYDVLFAKNTPPSRSE